MSLTKKHGLNTENAWAIVLDDYSTPDSWYDIGYELQVMFALNITDTPEEEDRVQYFDMFFNTITKVFNLNGDHLRMSPAKGEPVMKFMKREFGIEYEPKSLEEPLSDYMAFQLDVLWDKGALDLRILSEFKDKMDTISSENNISIKLMSLCIIPRSRQTMASKILGLTTPSKN